MNLSIVIVNWESKAYLEKCIGSIVAQTRMSEYEIVVIDAGSFDGCEQMLRQRYPQVRFIQSPTNLGFARANNRAFQASSGHCVLFLNPDTEVLDGAIDTLYASLMALPASGLVGGKLLNADRTVQSSCIQSMPTILNQMLNSEILRRRWPRSRLWGVAALYEQGSQAREVEAISGACLMVRRQTFDTVGGFSEDYFMYAEDMDLSHKARSAGYKNYYVPNAIVVHYGGSSSERAVNTFAAVMMPEAIWRFLRKTRGRTYGFGYRLAMLASAAARLAMLGIVWLGGQRRPARTASCRKWFAILRWSVNLDGLVKQYYPASRHPS
jgi:N-acetylglucosaminyl-diphospho-decaprenol L-rhamnosyltransferase